VVFGAFTAKEFAQSLLVITMHLKRRSINIPAAFLIEPIQGEAGVRVPPTRIFTRVREIWYGSIMFY